VVDLSGMAGVILRKEYVQADMGISGANFAVAETGAIGMVTNEGNGRLVTTLPRVHVALVGLEKLTPTLHDALRVLRALPRNATGQQITSYVTWISGTNECKSAPGGKKIMHVVFLDNGRCGLAKDKDFSQVLRCIRCGACANVCPVCRVVGGHKYGHVYIGAIGLIMTYFFHGRDKANFLVQNCVNCGACKEVCAAGIDLPRLIKEIHARIQDEEGHPVQSKLLGMVLKNRTLFHTLFKNMRWAQKPFAERRTVRERHCRDVTSTPLSLPRAPVSPLARICNWPSLLHRRLNDPDQSSLPAGGLVAAVGEEGSGQAVGAEVHGKDAVLPQARLQKLIPGQAPEIHGFGDWIIIIPEPGSPFQVEIHEFAGRRAQTWSANGENFFWSYVAGFAERRHAPLRKFLAVAAPAAVQGRHMTTAGVGQENGLAIRGLHGQDLAGSGGDQAVAFLCVKIDDHAGFRLDQNVAPVNLPGLDPIHNTQYSLKIPAVFCHGFAFISHFPGQVGRMEWALADTAQAGGEGRVHMRHSGKGEGDNGHDRAWMLSWSVQTTRTG